MNNPYPTDLPQLESWIAQFKTLHDRGVRLILDHGAATHDTTKAKIAKERAKALAHNACPDKAEKQVCKMPVFSGWRDRVEEWDDIEAHLSREGWLSYEPRELGIVELDIDSGDIEKVAARLRAMYQVLSETVSVSGKKRLLVRYDYPLRADGRIQNPKKTWTMPDGAGECLCLKATICDPSAVLAAMDVHEHAESADLSRLKKGGQSKIPLPDYTEEPDERHLKAAKARAIERIEDAREGERNNTIAAQAWLAGKAARTSETMDEEEVKEEVVDAAVSRCPDEPAQARATASRQFDEGADSAEHDPFKVSANEKTEGRTASHHRELLMEPETISERDETELAAWECRTHGLLEWTPTEMEGGLDAPRPHGLDQKEDGELGFLNDYEAAILLAVEEQLPNLRLLHEGTSPNAPIQGRVFTAGRGFETRQWKDIRPLIGSRLHKRRYTVTEHRDPIGEDEDGKTKYQLTRSPKPLHAESSARAFIATAAKSMASFKPWYSNASWWDANPYLLSHPDGTFTDLFTGEQGPLTVEDLVVKRTGAVPGEWRGTPFEGWLNENIPGERDRLVFQCGLGSCAIGFQVANMALWLVGPGGSGKTGAAEGAAKALGIGVAEGDGYCQTLPVERLLTGKKAPSGFDATSGRMKLQSARMALAAGEPSPDDVLDTGTYKSLSGGGSADGRRIGGNSQTLSGTPFNLVVTANTLPYIKRRDDADALARRTFVVSFPVRRSAAQIDDTVNQRLMSPEWQSAYLGFIMEGAVKVIRHGGMPPMTEQQLERGVFPLQKPRTVGEGEGEDGNKARDGRLEEQLDTYRSTLLTFIEERTEEEEGSAVWLSTEPDDADLEFLRDLVRLAEETVAGMEGCRISPTLVGIVKAMGKIESLNTGRRRGIKGVNRSHACLLDRKLRG